LRPLGLPSKLAIKVRPPAGETLKIWP